METLNEVAVVDEVAQTAGQSLIKANYTTAMQVFKPRNLPLIESRILQEAAIAGDDFYYSWKAGDSFVEGLTIGAAIALARNMGNCAVPVEVEETKDTYVFKATFIDLETGFNLQRAYRQRKTQNIGEKYKNDDRGKDIVFQIGQSKAIRNVVLGAVPNWLQKKVLVKAKENVSGKIAQMGKERAREMLFKKAKALGVSLEAIEKTYGKAAGWDTEKLVMISGALRGIEDGFATADELFSVEKSPNAANELLKSAAKQEAIPATEPLLTKEEIVELSAPVEPSEAHPDTLPLYEENQPVTAEADKEHSEYAGRLVSALIGMKAPRTLCVRKIAELSLKQIKAYLEDTGATAALAEYIIEQCGD
ncbi:MAG: hypothetical protein LBT81_01675 [Helicobacteraceae bacterium]|jgi:hypothetical protein|nr:hypothetical protein [Helicobacteraceae bacterium]